jgi:hypothetical protein
MLTVTVDMTIDDLLDPRRLALVTGWSFEAWVQALEAARVVGIFDWQMASLVRSGVEPPLIMTITKALAEPKPDGLRFVPLRKR